MDGARLAKYLHDTGLKIQEFWLLYTAMNLEDVFKGNIDKIPKVVDNVEFHKHILHYFRTNLPDVDSTITWADLAFQLEEKGWIDIFQTNRDKLDFRKCKTTSKFKQWFLVSDIDEAFKDFLKYYPRFMYIDTGRSTAKINTLDLPLEQLTELYNVHIMKRGNQALHERCMDITERYIKDNEGKAPYKLSRYIELFDNIALSYTEEGKKSSVKRNRR